MAKKKAKQPTAEQKKLKKVHLVLWIVFGSIFLTAAIAIALGLATDSQNHYLSDEEKVVLGRAQLVAALGDDDGSSMNKERFDILYGIAQKVDKNADWFNGYYGFKFDTEETAKKLILTIADSKYCATLTFDSEKTKIIDYSFREEKCDGEWVFLYSSD